MFTALNLKQFNNEKSEPFTWFAFLLMWEERSLISVSFFHETGRLDRFNLDFGS